jgi:hypothetical protein
MVHLTQILELFLNSKNAALALRKIYYENIMTNKSKIQKDAEL